MKKTLCANEMEYSIIMEENVIKYRIRKESELNKRVDYIKVDSKSQVFRVLYENGLGIADIARLMESHYSFVYGVISISPLEKRVNTQVSKAQMIRDEFERGKTPKEISIEMNTNYSYVYNVIRKYKEGK